MFSYPNEWKKFTTYTSKMLKFRYSLGSIEIEYESQFECTRDGGENNLIIFRFSLLNNSIS